MAVIEAYQVAPEYQESPLYFDMQAQIDAMGIIVFGNRDFNEHCAGNLEYVYDKVKSKGISHDKLIKVLSAYTGVQYDVVIIRGCCQGDWQYVACPADMNTHIFGIEYFNTGTEWQITDEYGDTYSVYAHEGYNDETYAEEIANAIGADPSDIVLHEFIGWQKTAMYN